MSSEMPASTWPCPKCKEPIGTITEGNDLVVTAAGSLIERTRIGTIVHCRCGKAMLWSGRRVILNSSELSKRQNVV